MKKTGLIPAVKAALIVGLLAGLVLGTFHFFLTEPIVDRAIQYEYQMKASQGLFEEQVVSRGTQKTGLVVGSAIFGLAVALIFGFIYSATYIRLPGSTPFKKSIVLGISAYVAIFVIPFLKYPSNPPGVGQADTIFFRQSLYLGFQMASIIGTAVVYLVYTRLITRKFAWPLATLLAITTYLAIVLFMFTLMPANPDPVAVPIDLLLDFRVLSFLGQTIMWLIIAFAYGSAWRVFARPTPPLTTLR